MAVFAMDRRIVDVGRYPWGDVRYLWGGGLWTPARISTALWLDAADARTITLVSGGVSKWDDKSGNERHAITAFGVSVVDAGLDDKSVIRFANLALMEHAQINLFLTGFTYCVLWKPASNSTNKQILSLSGSGYAYLQYANDWWLGSLSTTVPHNTEWSIKIGRLKDGGGDRFTDGTSNGLQSGSVHSNYYQFRYLGMPSYEGIQGDVAEIIVCSGVMADEDREKLEGYLAHKWGLQSNLPADHPYKNYAPKIQ